MHLKEENHKFGKILNDKDKLCNNHSKINFYFCNDCKLNICEECKINHHSHILSSILDIYPNKKKKESMEIKIINFEKKIKKLKNIIEEKKEEVIERFEKIERYVQFLIDITNKLFKKYNFSIYDYYNFENFNYFYNYLKDEKIFDEKPYFNYIFYNDKIKREKVDSSLTKINDEQNIINNNINNNYEYLLKDDYCDLKYFKDNLFVKIKYQDSRFDLEQYIKLFEFSEYTFKLISTYDLKYFKKIKSITQAKYGDYFLINFKNKKTIKFLEYDCSKKNFFFSKKEISSKKISLFNRHFYNCIDNKNGDIITSDYKELILWEKNDKKKHFNEKTKIIFQENYNALYNINDKIFLAKNSDFISFCDSDKNELIRSINYEEDIDYVSLLNQNLLILGNMKHYFLISLQFYEISQIIQIKPNIYPLKARDNLFIEFKIEKDKEIKIIKKIYNEEKGSFNKEEIILLKINCSTNSKVLITDKNDIVIGDGGLISIFTDVI